ncbi:MAG: hypothetical protein IKE92_06825 [Clostridiales bacterium]|nr:hypothetical protein [Clostridiales bacterium]
MNIDDCSMLNSLNCFYNYLTVRPNVEGLFFDPQKTLLTITNQPKDYTGTAGSTATFSVTAQGDELAYQWQVCSNGVWKTTAASGANTPTISFKISDSHNGKKYRCLVMDGYDKHLFSREVTVHVGIPLEITSNPLDHTGVAGSTATFGVTAQGTGLAYQWQVYSNGTWKNTAASGANTSKISFKITDAHDGMKYRCVVTDAFGQQLVSRVAVLHVGVPLAIKSQPKNYTGLAGSTATFSVTAQGTDLTYQWLVYSDGAWINSGANGSKTSSISFNISHNHNGKRYRCVITDRFGRSVVSNAATVTVSTPLVFTKQPSNYTGLAGSTATFSVIAKGTDVTYQWQVYSNGAWVNSGATGAKTSCISFNVKSEHNGKQYRCVISDCYGQKKLSNVAKVVVMTPLTITKQPVNYTGAAGSTATFSVTASGTGLTYQWQVYSDGAWNNSGAKGSKTSSISFNVNNNNNGKKYRCVITDSYGQKVTSNTVTVKVATPPSITKQPSNYVGVAGSTASFSVTASGTGLKYQWQVYSDGVWCNSGATGSKTSSISFNVNTNSNGKKYRCVITDSYGQKVTSNVVSVRVATSLTITKQPVNYSGLAGSTASFGVTASGTGLKYQWQVYSNGAWSNSGATGANTNKISFKVSSSHNGMKYRCVITDSYGQKVTTNTVSVRITTAATNYAMPADNSVEFDTTSPVIINNAAVSGVIGTEDELITATDMEETNALINDRIDGVESEEIEDKILIPVLEEPVNAEEEEVTENKLSLDGQQAVYSDVEETVDDEIAKGPSILKQPSEYKGKAGEKASFTVEAEGQGLRYQWQYCKNGEWINLDVEGADTTELILEITTADNGMKYRCVITDFLGYSVMTDVVTVYAITAK